MKEQTYFVTVGFYVHVFDVHPVGMESGTFPDTPSATISTSAPGNSWGNAISMRVSEAKPIFPYRGHLECGSGIRPGWALNFSVEEQHKKSTLRRASTCSTRVFIIVTV
jgi:hypothetical protein